MQTHPVDLYGRVETLFASMAVYARQSLGKCNDAERVLFISNSIIPTLEMSFVLPLREFIKTDGMAVYFLTEEQMKERFGNQLADPQVLKWLDEQVSEFRPTLAVFCRYSGPHAQHLHSWACHHKVPTIYHIDDDLLNVPREFGKKKIKSHRNPLRRATVEYLLDHVDLVYCSTPRLAKRLRQLGVASAPTPGRISHAGRVTVRARNEPVKTIGFMGIDYGYDLPIAIPAVVSVLRQNPEIRFELLGSIPKPPELDQFGERVVCLPPIRGYDTFLSKFGERNWHIGIRPLAKTPFNLLKSNNKWIEYTSVGAVTVASGDTVYDECCAEGCGILARTTEEWERSLTWLIRNPEERFSIAARAQEKLEHQYSIARLRHQVLIMFNKAKWRRIWRAGVKRLRAD